MSLPPEFLDDLRARVGLAQLIGRRVKLTRAGREMKGCCPFHNEKTPSFYVNEDKGFYHCFGCGAHGDALRFLMEADGMGFLDAVKTLAAEVGLSVPAPRERDPEAERRAGLAELVAAAGDWFRVRLAAPEGADARAYLARRQVPDDVAAWFGLGFAPDSRDALSKALTAKFAGLEPQQLLDAGLVGEADPGSRPGAGPRRFDRFRGRLQFPIHDTRGRMVGFGGRALGQVEPKYLNSAEGPLFHKGRLLYNFHRAAAPARNAGRLLIVEGYMDVVGLASVGITEAVAPLGTALGEDQMQLAWRLVPEPCLAFDGDAAGARAALRAAVRALPQLGAGRSFSFVNLPPGQDPDDLARSGGREAVEAVLAGARSLERLLFEAEAGAEPLDTPERRAGFRARLKALAQAITDEEIRRDYLRTWLARADALVRPPARAQPLRSSAWRSTRVPLPPLKAETRAAATSVPRQAQGMLLSTLSRNRAMVAHFEEMLVQLPLDAPSLLLARDRLLAGGECDSLLSAYAPLFRETADSEVLQRKIADTLASLAESHHIRSEDQLPRDLSNGDAFAREFARQQRLGVAKADARRRLTALAIDNDEA